MLYTTNYDLAKIELKDSPADITVINQNWDTIDQALKTVDGKTGGKISGVVELDSPLRSSKAEFLQTTVNATKGTAPDTTLWSYWSVMDKNGYNNENNRLAYFNFSLEPNNTTTFGFFVNKNEAGASEVPIGLYVRWLNGTTPQIAMTHQPDANSDDYSVASTQWVNTKIQNSPKTQLIRYD